MAKPETAFASPARPDTAFAPTTRPDTATTGVSKPETDMTGTYSDGVTYDDALVSYDSAIVNYDGSSKMNRNHTGYTIFTKNETAYA